MSTMTIAKSELVLGGQKSGKSRRAEMLAQHWLGQSSGHRAVFIATARPWDEEMRERIRRHQQDRAERLPGMAQFGAGVAQGGRPGRRADRTHRDFASQYGLAGAAQPRR